MSYFEIFCTILYTVLLIGFCAVLVLFAFFVIDYRANIPTDRQVKIKYDEFIKWISVEKEYNFDHTNWHFEKYGPRFGYCCDAYYCYFNFFDYCRYRILLLKVNKLTEKDNMENRRSQIIQHINNEIQKFSQLNEKK